MLKYVIVTDQTPKLPSYRNQSIDLQGKSIDWFLYDGNFSVQRVKHADNFPKMFVEQFIFGETAGKDT